MSRKFFAGVRKVVLNIHFWILSAIFIVLAVFYYSFSLDGSASAGLTISAFGRILLLLPMAYSAIVFGIRGGIISMIVSLAIMLPRAFFTNQYRVLTLFEIAGVTLVGIMLNLWIEGLQREKKRTLQLERNYRELFEKAHDAIWVHDVEGNIITANEATSVMCGYKLEDLIGMNVKTFMSEDSLKIADDIRRRLLSGQTMAQPYEQKLIKSDGTEVNLMLTTSLIKQDNQTKTFQHIARDVTEQKKMDAELRFYVQQITKAQEEERKRIARELHDDTVQSLVVISRQLDKLASAQPPLMSDTTPLEDLGGQIDSILDGVRRFSQDLRPSIIDDLGLIPALRWLASDLKEHFNISVDIEIVGVERRFPPEIELLLFRIAQEALRNVWRHSSASSAWVAIEFSERKTLLTVRDNGKGFKLQDRLGNLSEVAKLGLAGMAERAKLMGGELRITSESGKGTVVNVEVPV